MSSPFHHYYQRQAQHGAGLPYFHGVAIQRGSGLGNILNAGLRMILPGIKSVGKAVLKQGVSTGANILGDVLGGESVKTSAKRRATEGGQMLMNRALARAGLVGGRAATQPSRRRSRHVVAAKRRPTNRGKGRKRSQSGSGIRGVRRVTRKRRVQRRAVGRKSTGVRRRKRRSATLGSDIFS